MIYQVFRSKIMPALQAIFFPKSCLRDGGAAYT